MASRSNARDAQPSPPHPEAADPSEPTLRKIPTEPLLFADRPEAPLAAEDRDASNARLPPEPPEARLPPEDPPDVEAPEPTDPVPPERDEPALVAHRMHCPLQLTVPQPPPYSYVVHRGGSVATHLLPTCSKVQE
jgi:hypothetical protein